MNGPSLICGKGSVGSDPYRHNPHVPASSDDDFCHLDESPLVSLARLADLLQRF
jgi:hypothetical protein